MYKISKDTVVLNQLIVNYNKLNNQTRVRLRKKLNKNLDDMINGASEIEKSILKLSNKEYKKGSCEEIKSSIDIKSEVLKEEDKKMDLIQFD